MLVPFDVDDRVLRTPTDPERFAADMAGRVNALLRDPARARAMGEAGRRRAVERFSWRTIAERTLELYRSLASA